jgi:hypothetical protein
MTDRYYRMSAVKEFKLCRRAFWLKYGIHGFGLEEPETDGPRSGGRDIGTLAHLAIAELYRGRSWRALLDTIHEDMFGEVGPDPEWRKVYDLATLMVEGFESWLSETGSDANTEVLAIEERLTAYAGNYHGDDVYITGQPDLIVRDTFTGETVIDDWKTVASLERPTTLDIDDQKLTYGWLAEKNGYEHVARFRHTQLKKSKRTARATPPFYARHEVTYSQDQRDIHKVHLSGTIRDMVEAVQKAEADPYAHHSVLYPTPTRDCSWRCDFLVPCTMMDQGDDAEGFLNVNFLPRKAPSE